MSATVNTIINADNQGIELNILATKDYKSWLSSQDSTVQNWLNQTNKDGQGLTLIPNAQGELQQAVFVTKDPGHYFACGDLVNQLPAGQYLLNTNKQYRQAIAFAWAVGSYRFDRYKKNDKPLPILAVNDEQLVFDAQTHADGTRLTRDLINTPAADMMPEHLGQTMDEMAARFGATISHIIGDQLLTENYPTIHAVGRASINEPRLMDLHWGNETDPKVTLVGKGVCFDSGGLDLKPAAGMRYMKKDMGGAAHVIGLAHIIMAYKLPIRLRVLVPAVENAVSSNAMRPGDVITTRKGLTVEIDNTDAEGRLVLCDALDEAQNDNPYLLVDFATLTGAMRIALGTELPGFFSTSDAVARDLSIAGDKINDPVWRMPLYQPYDDLFKSEIADMCNSPTIGTGGAITAALYLQRFVNDSTDWVHFDIMAWNNRKLSGRPVGGEAFGIRAVFGYLQSRFTA